MSSALQLRGGEILWYSQGMHHLPGHLDWQDPGLAARLEGLPYTKRREEARLGRWTAKNAIALASGMPATAAALRDIVVANALDGAPEARIGDVALDGVIAMTDRADWAVCALMAGGGRIGCDLELVETRSNEFIADYFTAVERERTRDSGDTALYANLIWSAKESALKVLRTGLRRDTRSVEVCVEDGPDRQWNRLSVTDVDGRAFPGWWLRTGSFVLTVTAETDTAPPVSLQEPSPLHGATPSHAWLRNPYTARRD